MKFLNILIAVPAFVVATESDPWKKWGDSSSLPEPSKKRKLQAPSAPSFSPGGDIGPQSQYAYPSTCTDTPPFDWNITLLEDLSIGEAIEQGIYPLESTYLLDCRSFDVELFEEDCLTAPTGLDSFPLVFDEAEIVFDDTTFEATLLYTYNQTKIESSSLWTATSVGGYSKFCIRVNNYLEEDGDPFSREINFLEVIYKIEVENTAGFEATIDIEREDATDGGTDFINYDEEMEVYQCDDSFAEIPSPPPLFQGDFLQICVTTTEGSLFGIHSIKELDVDQDGDDLYPYVNGFLDSPLAASACIDSNTTAAVCKTKMQLISAYFDETDPDDLTVSGVAKLDYVGRRLSVDLPINLRFDNPKVDGRKLEEEIDGGFGLNVQLASGAGSDASVLSMGGVLSAAMAFLAAGLV